MSDEVKISLQEQQVSAGEELHGTITIGYQGRWDSLVINSQIENSSDVFSYYFLNGKKIKHPYARISIFREELKGNSTIEFVSSTNHEPAKESSSVKFRVSLIQEHKEIFSDIAYVRVIKAQ